MIGAGRPLVIAHRGAHGDGVLENTMAAFARAATLGADMIEFDVRLTGADELAILHDEGLGAVALRSGSLAAFARRTGHRPPLLTEVLDWAAGRIAVDAELKETDGLEAAASVLAAFAANGGELIVTSFQDGVLAELARLTPQIRRGLLVEEAAEGAPERAHECGATALLPEMALVDPALIEAVDAAGLDLIVWGFFAREHAALLSAPRLGGVITDDVLSALAARDA